MKTLLIRILLFTLFLSSAAMLHAAESSQDAAPSVAGAQELQAYTPVLRGVDNEELQELLTASLDTFTLQQTPPRSLNLLRRRMSDDVLTAKKVLSSRGYFKGTVKIALETGRQAPPQAIFTVAPGPRFCFGKTTILLAPQGDKKAPLPTSEEAGLVRGAPYLAKSVLSAQSFILTTLEEKGYPYPAIEDREVIADHATNTVTVDFLVQTGKIASFGSITVNGLHYVDQDYVLSKLPWTKGQLYDKRLLEKARASLIQSGLFNVVDFSKEPVNEEGVLPLTMDVVERKPRTVRAGLRYRTDTGPGAKLEWEHRTLFGNGEHFSAAVDVDKVKQQFDLTFRKPALMNDDLSLLVQQKYMRERDDAYDGDTLHSSVGLEYRLNKRLTLGAGVAYHLSRLDENDKGKETYGLLSVPAVLSWDSRNDILNPTKGWRFSLSGTPYFDTLGSSTDFMQGLVSYTHYLRLIGEDTLILALRGLLGVTQGAQLDDVPSNVRFYAGGGSSIRGYAYRKAGDLDKDGDPIGGRSVFESTAELRWRFLGDLGMVFFTDVGRAFEDQFPNFDEELFVGAGTGFRYYSFVGPIGLDVAFPLNRRSGEDDYYQIYISLGQSF